MSHLATFLAEWLLVYKKYLILMTTDEFSGYNIELMYMYNSLMQVLQYYLLNFVEEVWLAIHGQDWTTSTL